MGPRIAKTILVTTKREKYHCTEYQGFLYSNSHITVWYWQSDRNTEKYNHREDTETDPYKYAQLIFNKGIQMIQWRQGGVFFAFCFQ